MTLDVTKNYSATSSIAEAADFTYGTVKKVLNVPVSAPRRKTKNEILANLSLALYSEIEPFMEKVSFSRGETIFQACDEIKYVYFPDNLVASRLVLMEDGSMIEVGMFGHDGILGVRALMGANKTYCLTVSETNGSAVRIKTRLLKRFFNSSAELQKTIFNFYEKYSIQVSQRAACRSRHTISKQLCTWLLQFQEKFSASELSLTQETIANRLGARRSSITIAINELQAKKILFSERGSIKILDREALLREACECYTIMQCEQMLNAQLKYLH